VPDVGLKLTSRHCEHWEPAETSRYPGETPRCTARSEAPSVDIVHTQFAPSEHTK
jgi:hypothetical protein